MRTFPLSSSLPLCNGIVVLDERLPVKGDGLCLSGRFLIDGCEQGRGGEGESRSEDEITPINEIEGSVIRAEGNVA